MCRHSSSQHMQILEGRRRKPSWKRVPDSHPHVDRGICRRGDKGRNWIPIQNSPQKDELLRRLSAADSLTPMSLLRRRKLEPSSLIRLHPKVQAFIRRRLNRRARLPRPAAATLMFLINGIRRWYRWESSASGKQTSRSICGAAPANRAEDPL